MQTHYVGFFEEKGTFVAFKQTGPMQIPVKQHWLSLVRQP